VKVANFKLRERSRQSKSNIIHCRK